jgi:hypothetical protein
MVKLYYHDNEDSDQRLPHEGDPVPTSALEELGIYIANIPERANVDLIAKEKGYENRDEVKKKDFECFIDISSPFHPKHLEKNTQP